MGTKNIRANETDRLTVWVITDNYYDASRTDSGFAKRYRSAPGRSIHSEHGLSFYIETRSEGKTGTCMFDFGMDPIGVSNNMDLLNIDIAKTDTFALSHGHFDHFMGALEILNRNRSKIKPATPFYAGKETFLNRYSLRPGSDFAVDLGQLNKSDLESFGITVHEITEPMEIIQGGYISGDIERSTSYETPIPNLLVKRGDRLVPDDFRGEQALFFNVKDKGLVILSGCAHAGIVNTVRHIQNITGLEKVHAIMGGFHLINARQKKISNTIEDIQSIDPDIIVPLHCTGFEAVTAFMESLPNAFFLNTAGTKYTF